jgi:hypothetical protein
MDKDLKDLVFRAIGMLAQITGMKIAYHAKRPGTKVEYPDGLIRINHGDVQLAFAVQAKKRITRPAVAMEKVLPTMDQEERILVTTYVTPPIADMMRRMDLWFMDLAGNAYINKPPLFIFIKGNKPPEEAKTKPIKRLFKPAGLKVLFALLNKPDLVDLPYRQIAEITGVALGTVDWIFRDLNDMRFMVKMGKRKRKLTDLDTLRKRWVEAYPDQLRPKLVIDRFKADHPDWWKTVDLLEHNICWGGEVAAAKLTKQLKPAKVIIYGDEMPGKLIIQHKLRKATEGNVELIKQFWEFDHAFADRGIAPPILFYADLMATGDDRNIETAGFIYDNYIAQPNRQN